MENAREVADDTPMFFTQQVKRKATESPEVENQMAQDFTVKQEDSETEALDPSQQPLSSGRKSRRRSKSQTANSHTSKQKAKNMRDLRDTKKQNVIADELTRIWGGTGWLPADLRLGPPLRRVTLRRLLEITNHCLLGGTPLDSLWAEDGMIRKEYNACQAESAAVRISMAISLVANMMSDISVGKKTSDAAIEAQSEEELTYEVMEVDSPSSSQQSELPLFVPENPEIFEDLPTIPPTNTPGISSPNAPHDTSSSRESTDTQPEDLEALVNRLKVRRRTLKSRIHDLKVEMRCLRRFYATINATITKAFSDNQPLARTKAARDLVRSIVHDAMAIETGMVGKELSGNKEGLGTTEDLVHALEIMLGSREDALEDKENQPTNSGQLINDRQPTEGVISFEGSGPLSEAFQGLGLAPKTANARGPA